MAENPLVKEALEGSITIDLCDVPEVEALAAEVTRLEAERDELQSEEHRYERLADPWCTIGCEASTFIRQLTAITKERDDLDRRVGALREALKADHIRTEAYAAKLREGLGYISFNSSIWRPYIIKILAEADVLLKPDSSPTEEMK